MEQGLSPRERNRRQWLGHIESWKQSALSKKAYCARHHLGYGSFQRWYRISTGEAVNEPEQAARVTLLPVSLVEPIAAKLTLRLSNQLHIEIPTGFDPTTLKQLIRVLQSP